MWLKTLKWLALINFVCYATFTVLQIVFKLLESSSTVYNSCKTTFYIITTILALPPTFLFLGAGFLIYRSINKYEADTQYE